MTVQPWIWQILLGYASVLASALVVWVWALWRSHTDHKLHVAEHYVRRPEMDQIEQTLSDMKGYMESQFRELLKTVYELKGRNGHGNGSGH